MRDFNAQLDFFLKLVITIDILGQNRSIVISDQDRRRPESVAGITWRSSSTVMERKKAALALNTPFTVDEIITAIKNTKFNPDNAYFSKHMLDAICTFTFDEAPSNGYAICKYINWTGIPGSVCD